MKNYLHFSIHCYEIYNIIIHNLLLSNIAKYDSHVRFKQIAPLIRIIIKPHTQFKLSGGNYLRRVTKILSI